MSKLKNYTKIATAMVLLLVGLLVLPWIDLEISEYFYHKGDFKLQGTSIYFVWDWIIPILLVMIGLGIFIVWLIGYLRNKKWILNINTKVMLLTSGSMFLGTGLIINGIFKTFWGRARPYQILEFGGVKFFTAPFVLSKQCEWDCSFMSGHASIGFWSLSLALLVKGRFRNLAIVGSLMLGIAMGLIRIIEGNHFVSDVFFSGMINVLLIGGLYRYLFTPEKLNK